MRKNPVHGLPVSTPQPPQIATANVPVPVGLDTPLGGIIMLTARSGNMRKNPVHGLPVSTPQPPQIATANVPVPVGLD